MNERQLLREPDPEPTPDIIAACLGAANGAYLKFAEELRGHDIQLDWRYYNDGKAWLGKGLYKWATSRGTPKERTAFWFSVWEGFFRVTVYVPEKHRAGALELPVGGEMREMIAEAKQMGKLKFFPLTFDLRSDERFDEIFTLIDFRKVLK